MPSSSQEFTKRNAEHPDPLITLMLEEPNIDPESLPRINIPVLITVGENDLILPSETETIISHLPDADLKVVKGADHGSYIEGSEVMGEMLISFLRERGY